MDHILHARHNYMHRLSRYMLIQFILQQDYVGTKQCYSTSVMLFRQRASQAVETRAFDRSLNTIVSVHSPLFRTFSLLPLSHCIRTAPHLGVANALARLQCRIALLLLVRSTAVSAALGMFQLQTISIRV